MTAETKTIKSTFDTGMDELRTLRDEVRLKLHLAKQDAKSQWESTFEPKIEKLELQIRSATDNTRDAVRDAIDQAKDSFKTFRDRLTGGDDDDSGKTSLV